MDRQTNVDTPTATLGAVEEGERDRGEEKRHCAAKKTVKGLLKSKEEGGSTRG